MGCCTSTVGQIKREYSSLLSLTQDTNKSVSESPNCNFMGLKAREVRILRRSWQAVLENEPRFCELLFLQLFRQHTEMRRSFNFEGLTEEQLTANPAFVSHAANFHSFFQHIHDHLSNEAELIDHALTVGRQHAEMKIRTPDIFESTYWLIIARAAMILIMENCKVRGIELLYTIVWYSAIP